MIDGRARNARRPECNRVTRGDARVAVWHFRSRTRPFSGIYTSCASAVKIGRKSNFARAEIASRVVLDAETVDRRNNVARIAASYTFVSILKCKLIFRVVRDWTNVFSLPERSPLRGWPRGRTNIGKLWRGQRDTEEWIREQKKRQRRGSLFELCELNESG